MIDIETLREYYMQSKVFMSEHASTRGRKRKISQEDIKCCIMSGEIIEQYPEDFPWPSCLVFGYAKDGKVIHVVMSDNGEFSKIITTYIPDTDTFEDDLRTRKEK